MIGMSCSSDASRNARRRGRGPAGIAVVVAFVALVTVIAVAPAGLQAAEAASSATEPKGDISLFGSYLAARQASNDRDRAEAARYLREALRLDPENRMLLERAMVYELSSGHYDEAVVLAPRVVEAIPDNLGANVLLGLKAMTDGNYPAARVRFAANDSGPIALLASSLLEMWVHQLAGDGEAARQSSEGLDEASTFGSFRAYHAALLADMQGRVADAEEAYASAHESGARLRVVDAYGRFLERHGKQERAIEIYRDFLAEAPNHPVILASLERVGSGAVTGPLIADPFAGAAETLYSMGSALSQDGGGDLALIYLNMALYVHPGFDMANFLIADIHDRQSRHEEAIAAYSAVDPASPLKREAEIQAAVNLDSLDRVDEAKARIDALVEQDPTDRTALISGGAVMRAHERFAEALQYYDRAIRLIETPTQDDWQLYYFRGISHERTDQWALAEADFKKALELEPEQPLVLNYLGYSWIDLGLHLDEALEMVKLAVDQRPDDGYIVDSLGWAYYRLGDYDKAVEELERAVELRPDDAVINDHLGDAYWRVDRLLEARFQWDHALSMEPTDVETDKIRKKLELGLDAVEARKVVAEVAPAGEASEETAPGARRTPAGESEPGEDVAARASPEQHDARRYTIEPGDTLWGIALRFLGSGTHYDLLFEANRDRVGEGYLIWPGDELVIPEGP